MVARLGADLHHSKGIKPSKQAAWMFPEAPEDFRANVVRWWRHVEILTAVQDIAAAYDACESCMRVVCDKAGRAYAAAGVSCAVLVDDGEIVARCLVWRGMRGVCRAPKAYGVRAQALLDVLDAAGLRMSSAPAVVLRTEHDTRGMYPTHVRVHVHAVRRPISAGDVWDIRIIEGKRGDYMFDTGLERFVNSHIAAVTSAWEFRRTYDARNEYEFLGIVDARVWTNGGHAQPARRVVQWSPYRDMREHSNAMHPRY